MTNAEKFDALVLVVLAVVIAAVGAALGRSLLSEFPRSMSVSSATDWFFRFRLFHVTTEVLALGALAYILPRSSRTIVASRVAAVLALPAIGAEVGEWSLAGRSQFPVDGGAVAAGVGHVGQLVALGAVVAMWALAERPAADLS